MADPIIICPKCKAEIKLTESLAGPLLIKAKDDFEKKIKQACVDSALEADREATIRLQSTISKQDEEVEELRACLRKEEDKLAEAQKAQAAVIRQKRDLDIAQRELDLTVEKRIESGLGAAYDRAKEKAEELVGLKVVEKEETIRSMRTEIDNLRRKAEQGSQQMQGEAQEVELENMLTSSFPYDTITPVPKGIRGGDILQKVIWPTGMQCGTILWESKHTKIWNDGWLAKLRDDQREAKADVCVLVSRVLPKDVVLFGLVGGVWVATPQVVVPLTILLRKALSDVALARKSSEGIQTKSEMVYEYLTGPQFRLRVQAIVESFTMMAEDLNSEKKAITKQWAKRETQIQRVMQGTVGMYGDLQGIAGKGLKEIKELEYKNEV